MKILSYFFALFVATTAFAAFAEPVFNFAEWKTTACFTLPLQDADASARSVSGYAGLRLSFADFDARCYWTLPKTETATLASASGISELCNYANDARYGAALWLFTQTAKAKQAAPLRLPSVTVRAGSLSYARSVARLKNPAPSGTAYPLSKASSAKYGIGAALPTLTASAQPLSLAVSMDFAPVSQTKALPVIEAAVQEDTTAFVSLHSTQPLSKHTRIEYAVSAARFCLESSATMQKANAGFEKDWYNAALVEAAYASPFFKLQTRAGMHQSPYGGNSLWLQGAAQTGFGGFLLDTSLFLVPTAASQPDAAPLIGGSSSVCRIRRQVGIHPQAMWLFGTRRPLALRIGAHLLWQERVTATKYADSYETHKLSAGVRLESKTHTVQCTGSAVNIGVHGAFHTAASIPERYYNATVGYTLTTAAVRLALTTDTKHYPAQPQRGTAPQKHIYALHASISPDKARRFTVQASATATYKAEKRTASELNAAATVRLRTHKMRTVLKCAVALPLQ